MIIKIKDNILNEDFALGQGFNACGMNSQGYSYSIVPLSFNLMQTGNTPEQLKNNKCYKHYISELVKGICPYDNKKHMGMIKYFYYVPNSDETMPKLVYIHDFDTQKIIPLLPETVKTYDNKYKPDNRISDYFFTHGNKIDYDFKDVSPVQENVELTLDSTDDLDIDIIKVDKNNIDYQDKETVSRLLQSYLDSFNLTTECDKIDYSKVISYVNCGGSYILKTDSFPIVFMMKYIVNTSNTCDLNWLDVSNVKDFSYVFSRTTFIGDISKWDMKSAVDLTYMFMNSEFNGDISNWNTSNVETTYGMFQQSKFNGDISKWDMSKNTSMGFMFYGSKFNQPIGDWNVSNVCSLEAMFQKSRFNQDISKWDVSEVIYYNNMFDQSRFSKSIKNWNISNSANATLKDFNLPKDKLPEKLVNKFFK